MLEANRLTYPWPPDPRSRPSQQPGALHNEEQVACPAWVYARLKEWRAVATRYEKTARAFLGVLCIAATMDWLKG